jgi:hypothetical protein
VATLHVRNVPDDLYEQLRERAAANGRSIGAEVVVVLERELGHVGSRPWRSMFSRRRFAPTPFHRFTPQGRSVVAQAKDEAHELRDPAIGTEHLLLALLREHGTVASFVLDSSGLDYEQARSAVAEVQRERVDEPAGMPFTPGAKKAMELALRYCIELRSSKIGPEHLLLGIAREEDGLGARILAGAGLDVPTIRQGLAVLTELQPYELGVESHGFRVVELTGEAADWEQQLNSLAGRGYELVEIVAGKAIFRVPVPEP